MSVIIRGMKMPEMPAFHAKRDKLTYRAGIVIERGKAPRLLVIEQIGMYYNDGDLKSYEIEPFGE